CNGADICHVTFDCQPKQPLNCSDGVFCNGDEGCDAVLGCQAGTAPVIDDGVMCTDDSCDEVGDVVVNTPVNANCDDGDVCNGADICHVTFDCQPKQPLNCSDAARPGSR
ncbi:MAG: hypothetical protein JRG80_15075, partial [Deltaproteobacteria bacterium]|nr:hypothetical protein [Deltaproteobacteria bacterium]